MYQEERRIVISNYTFMRKKSREDSRPNGINNSCIQSVMLS